ncbi:MAG: hypothetical protein HKM98_00310 [Gammaproteobacteria bacterium]|nr:hypothetical protein [Gammaproteobacteria bacterium]
MANVIVMTAGLAGSSVLTGLIARAGYWTGHKTFRKQDYDTFENERLIELNQKLFDVVGYTGNYTEVFPGWVIDAIERKIDQIDTTPFRDFIADCERNSPWIWKDPRLNLTIRAWARWLDLKNTRFIMISREEKQSWISSTLRRQIQTFSYHASYNSRVMRSIQEFFQQNNLQNLSVVYENLMVSPEQTLEELNQFLGTQLTISDLESIYARDLYRRQHGTRSAAKALLIYLKNYRERRFIDDAP